jgi:hypothetical protein
MNTRLVNILIVLSLGVLLAGYYFKSKHRNSAADQLQQSLKDLLPLLPPTATVYFNCAPENLETYMQARYLLAPRVLLYTTDTTADTLFRLLPAASATGQTHIVWQHTYDRFHYLLTIKPR